MKRSKKYKGVLFFLLVFVLYLGMTFFLFYKQSMLYGGLYFSDSEAYIDEIQGVYKNGEISYPVMFWIARLLSLFMTPNHALAVTLTGLNGLTFLTLFCWVDRSLQTAGREKFGYGASVLTFCLLVVSMLFPFGYLGKYHDALDDGFLFRYVGTFSPNPFHNATYLAARPFAAVTFFMAVDILRDYERKEGWFRKETAAFSAMLLLTTMTKPSFTLVLVSVCGLVMLWRLCRSRGKGMKAALQFGIAFLPTFLALLYQYRGMFSGEVAGEENGIVWSFLTAWKEKTDNVPLSILLGTAFPLGVLLFQRKKALENGALKLAWQCFGVALFTMLFLCEKGYRAEHMNFAWGYMYGLFFLFVTSAVTLAGETRRRGQPLWQLLVQWLLFGAHLVCGVDYLAILLRGGLYY